MRIALVILMLSCVPAKAENFALIVDSWSSHSTGIWNEHNQTIGIEYTIEREGWHTLLTAASYTDSLYRDSWYGGAGLMYPFVSGDVEVSAGGFLLYFHHGPESALLYSVEPDLMLGAGGVDVYTEAPKQRYIAPIPGISLRYENVGANLAIIPPVNSYDPWTAAIQLKLIF